MEELVFEGKTYISSKRAAAVTGYAKDYVGQLAREGRIEARLVGRSWYVYEPSITKHRFDAAREKEEGHKNEEIQKTSEEIDKKDIDSSWETPTYKPETVEEIETAWRQWFTDSTQGSIKKYVEDVPLKEDVEVEPVPLTIIREKEAEVESPPEAAQEGKLETEPAKSPKPVKSSKRIWKALFVAIIILSISIAVLGLGFGGSFGGILKDEISFIQYLQGINEIKIISK